MKNNFLNLGIFCLMTVMLFSCQSKVETTTSETIDQDEVKREIATLESTYADAMNLGDANAAKMYYAEDATSYPPNGAPVVGRAAIIESIKKEISIMKGSKVSFQTEEVHVSNDGIQVLEIGAYSATDSTGAVANTGNYMALFEKRDGKFVCVRDMVASNKPMK